MGAKREHKNSDTSPCQQIWFRVGPVL